MNPEWITAVSTSVTAVFVVVDSVAWWLQIRARRRAERKAEAAEQRTVAANAEIRRLFERGLRDR